MKQKIYFVDAFAEKLFSGNPAGVCITDQALSTEQMQQIAAENNLSETAFAVKDGEDFSIRWFTPKVEVKLCGHATLATSHVIFNHTDYNKGEIKFSSISSGILTVKRKGELLILNFPADTLHEEKAPDGLIEGLGTVPKEIYIGRSDYLLVFENQEAIENLKPDFSKLLKVQVRGAIATAMGNNCDFVSRFFAPAVGVNEDPVTGSAHTSLIPFWSKRLNKTDLFAKQISSRGGVLYCRHLNDRVEIGGKAITYLVGEINIS
jgi:PhzF family phenazine biosynthesis protein